ncbi:hypothetical protein [Bacillus sp. B1-b2]|uniref:hypothetical protein n=1 Tax=Bacillus sp. B1-b2 TaxID=2653201 RepID=UPI001261FAE8|nr:hypothetical protein [Bacillus sp. B1-b2]KAB7671672.1 hypothetical protein F9279_04950 [Bacillus sp. B1-b2]
MDYSNIVGGDLEHMTVETNTFGNKNMYDNGQLIATQKSGVFPETTATYENGHQIAGTKENIINGIDIIQDGEHTGIIKEDINGDLSLYDSNQNKLAYMDPEGNVKSVMNHMDPLSQVDRVNFQQLKFYAEG